MNAVPRQNAVTKLSGKFEDVPPKQALELLGLSERNGLFRAVSAKADISVRLAGGKIFAVSRDGNEDLIVQLLLRRETIDAEDYKAALAMCENEKEKRPGEILVELGALAESDIEDAAHTIFQLVINELTSWREGEFSFEATPEPPFVENDFLTDKARLKFAIPPETLLRGKKKIEPLPTKQAARQFSSIATAAAPFPSSEPDPEPAEMMVELPPLKPRVTTEPSRPDTPAKQEKAFDAPMPSFVKKSDSASASQQIKRPSFDESGALISPVAEPLKQRSITQREMFSLRADSQPIKQPVAAEPPKAEPIIERKPAITLKADSQPIKQPVAAEPPKAVRPLFKNMQDLVKKTEEEASARPRIYSQNDAASSVKKAPGSVAPITAAKAAAENASPAQQTVRPFFKKPPETVKAPEAEESRKRIATQKAMEEPAVKRTPVKPTPPPIPTSDVFSPVPDVPPPIPTIERAAPPPPKQLQTPKAEAQKPVSKAESQPIKRAQPAPVEAGAGKQKQYVVILTADYGVAKAVHERLTGGALSLYFSRNAEELLNFLKKKRHLAAIVLIDGDFKPPKQTGGMDGFTAMQKICADYPIVKMLAFAEKKDGKAALAAAEAKAMRHIDKPSSDAAPGEKEKFVETLLDGMNKIVSFKGAGRCIRPVCMRALNALLTEIQRQKITAAMGLADELTRFVNDHADRVIMFKRANESLEPVIALGLADDRQTREILALRIDAAASPLVNAAIEKGKAQKKSNPQNDLAMKKVYSIIGEPARKLCLVMPFLSSGGTSLVIYADNGARDCDLCACDGAIAACEWIKLYWETSLLKKMMGKKTG